MPDVQKCTENGFPFGGPLGSFFLFFGVYFLTLFLKASGHHFSSILGAFWLSFWKHFWYFSWTSGFLHFCNPSLAKTSFLRIRGCHGETFFAMFFWSYFKTMIFIDFLDFWSPFGLHFGSQKSYLGALGFCNYSYKCLDGLLERPRIEGTRGWVVKCLFGGVHSSRGKLIKHRLPDTPLSLVAPHKEGPADYSRQLRWLSLMFTVSYVDCQLAVGYVSCQLC